MRVVYGASVTEVKPYGLSYGVWTAGLIALLCALRVVGLAYSPLELHGDEAQYFAWSRDLAAGYFSKPPLIAWVIAASTALVGDTGEWAVRVWSPVVHGLTAGIVFLAGRQLFGERDGPRAGMWGALAYLTLPGIVVSAGIASTDALLLLWVAVVVWAWAELREGGGWRWVVLLGVALGLGLMSKYAMVFIGAGLVLNGIFDAKTRAAVSVGRVAVVAVIVGVIVAPNVLWNLRNDFATASHTVANANLHAELLNPLEGLEFVLSQFGVMGPVLFVLLALAVVKGWRDETLRALAVFVLVPLGTILAQAFLSRANANWAASAYVPGTLLVVGVWARSGWLKAGVGVNALVALVLSALTLSPALADAVGAANSFKRVRGWEATVTALEARADGFGTIATDNRMTFYALEYYALGDALPLRMWQMGDVPHNHAELTRPLLEGASEPILFVNYHGEHLARVRADFVELEPLDHVVVELGGGKVRRLAVWRAEGYRRAERE